MVFTDTVKFWGVVPVPGDTDSQELPDVTVAVRLFERAAGLVSIARF